MIDCAPYLSFLVLILSFIMAWIAWPSGGGWCWASCGSICCGGWGRVVYVVGKGIILKLVGGRL